VGQGDAHIILYHDVQILVDAGEKKDVLACLGKYMPQTDHHIEFAIMTHPEFDHAGGLPLPR
jgi:metal-dependent hydrolase (beta-lactamase superfamily II)